MKSRDRAIAERYISRDLDDLHPQVKDAFKELAVDLSNQHQLYGARTAFRVFEGYRSPMRQRYLFEQEPKVTNAGAWESAHNFGFAVDFVPWVFADGQWQWSWDMGEDWNLLKQRAEIFGLRVPVEWDLGHVVHPSWFEIKYMIRNAAEK